MMSAAHYVAPEHTLLHQASILSFCYKCVHVYIFTILEVGIEYCVAGASLSATCSMCQAGTYWTGSGEEILFEICLAHIKHWAICAHIHAEFCPMNIHQMISHWCCLTKRSEYVVTGASGSFACIQCQAGTYSTGIGAHFELSCTYVHILRPICT